MVRTMGRRVAFNRFTTSADCRRKYVNG